VRPTSNAWNSALEHSVAQAREKPVHVAAGSPPPDGRNIDYALQQADFAGGQRMSGPAMILIAKEGLLDAAVLQ